jgi:hypothetical protein
MMIDSHVHFWKYDRGRDGWITMSEPPVARCKNIPTPRQRPLVFYTVSVFTRHAPTHENNTRVGGAGSHLVA